jgi:hypothetical protein
MILPGRLENIQDSRLTLTTLNFPQQTLRIPIPRSWALEEIFITVQFTSKAAITTQFAYGLLNALRRVSLEINDGIQPRTPVNVTGPGLLQLISHEGIGLDRSTLSVMGQLGQGFLANTGVYRITYRIPLVHPAITGGLRAKCLLPVHLFPQDPILVLDFAPAAEICSAVADPFSAAAVEVWTFRRDFPRRFAQYINDQTKGNPIQWFIRSDIQETIYPLSTSLTSSEQRFEIPKPGQYSSLLMHMLKGNAALTLADISASTAVGTETLWRIESAGTVFRQWRMKQAQTLNDYSRVTEQAGIFNLNVLTLDALKLTQTGTAVITATNVMVPNTNWGGALALGYGVQDPHSVFHDFLTDGLTDVDELGSLLDCNPTALAGLKMEIIGAVTTPANQASSVGLVGRRFYDDLSKYQAVERLAA